jgi:AraC family transcriptional activator of pobA
MKQNSKIKLYDTRTFTDKFMPSDELRGRYKGEYNEFLIVHVEDMYHHVARAVPPSKAINHTLIYLTAGEAYMNIGSELYTIHENEMLVVPAGQIFSFEEYDSGKFNRGYLCNFNDKMLAGKIGTGQLHKEFEFLKIWGHPYLSLQNETSRYIRQLLERLYTAYSQEGTGNLLMLQSYLIALLCEMKEAYQPLQADRQSAGLILANKFRELLSRYITTKHRVSDYAQLLHVTPNHLNKSVKTITSRSPTKWIDETLLLEAKVLLAQTQLSAGEIASSIGIDDQSYFSRLFKKYEGMTPLDYRKKSGIPQKD